MNTQVKLSYPLYERRGASYLTKLVEEIEDERIYDLSFKLHTNLFFYKTMPNLTGAEVKAEIQRRIRNYDGTEE